ncbi:ATP synthase subunit I [Terribacillus sp. 7520-G]|uniref:ATP synthase subunit I n=2 Tax=Bacillaceae TaxID=186817 RepID=UPI0035153B9A
MKMQQVNKMIRARQYKWMLYLLALLMLGAGFTPYQRIFLGLFLGTSVSFFSMWLLQRKVRQFTEAAATHGRIPTLGTLSRMAASVLAVMLALRFDAYFHLTAVVIGLAAGYIIIFIDSFFTSLKD